MIRSSEHSERYSITQYTSISLRNIFHFLRTQGKIKSTFDIRRTTQFLMETITLAQFSYSSSDIMWNALNVKSILSQSLIASENLVQ